MTFTKETIAIIIIGTISTAALILGIIAVSNGGHECRGDMMQRGQRGMMQGQFPGEEGRFMQNTMNRKIMGSGAMQPVVQEVSAE